MESLHGKTVAILVADGFEQVELTEPKKALEQAGAKTEIVSPAKGKVKGWNHTDWGQELPVDVPLDQAEPDGYDALLLPGGVMNPDKLRANPAAVRFVKHFFQAGKPVAAICHGPQVLISANTLRGRTLTCWPSIAIDVKNAGGLYVDKPVVEDGNLITSRKPDDVPMFSDAIIKALTGS
jgi:protease I